MKLYELAEAYNRVADLFDEEGSDWRKSLDDIADAFNDKAESVAKMVRQLEAEAKLYSEEARRLSDKAAATANKVANLKGYLMAMMQATGIDQVKGSIFNIFPKTSPPSCIVEDESIIPRECQRVIPEQTQPDKKAILDAIAEGIAVPGARVEAGNKFILIK